MKRDYDAAIRAAVNGLYNGGADDMENALRTVLESLDPEMATLMHDDEEAALTMVNRDEDAINSTDDDDGPEEEELGFYDEDLA